MQPSPQTPGLIETVDQLMDQIREMAKERVDHNVKSFMERLHWRILYSIRKKPVSDHVLIAYFRLYKSFDPTKSNVSRTALITKADSIRLWLE